MKPPPYDLVFLDMDGTLVDERSAWEWIHHHFGVSNDRNAARYLRGEIDDLEFMRTDIELWTAKRGKVHVSEIRGALAHAPLMHGAKDFVRSLREAGVKTVLVTGGIDLLADRVCRETGIDHYLANSLELDAGGFLTGEGVLRVPIVDKGTPTRDYREKAGARLARTAAVGNSRFDIPMFRETGRCVAFCPVDDEVRAAAHAVVEEKDLTKVLPHLLPPHGDGHHARR